MVELVDNYNVKGIRRDLLEPFLMQGLDHREDVPTASGLAASVDLAK